MSMSAIKVLIVVTSHSQLGTTGKTTGYYLPEVTHPHHELTSRGITVDIASPKGGLAPLDPSSLNLSDPINKKFYETKETRQLIENTMKLSEINSADYDAILFAGGHGTMFDFPNDQDVKRLIKEFYEQGSIVSAVCHGPAALVDVKLSNGKFVVSGKKVAAFTNDEEEAAELTKIMPFLLETKLIENGAQHVKAPLFQKNVVVDGQLITGQNPASAAGVGEAIAKALLDK